MEIFRIIQQNSLNLSCCPGSCLYTSYQLLLEKRDDKRIFLITDGYITNKYEIELAEKVISNCQIEGINVMAIGVGQFPLGIDKIFPNCCYSPNISMLPASLIGYFHHKTYSESEEKIPEKYIKDNKFDYESLYSYIDQEQNDKILVKSIKESDICLYNLFFTNNIVKIIEKDAYVTIKDPRAQIYRDGIFEGHKILVVILYLGGYILNNEIKDENINEQIFRENTGKVLKDKGFDYDLSFSYEEATNKITSRTKDGFCPYSEIWIFCSDGSGETPKGGKKEYQVKRERNEKTIIPFLEIVSEYNRNGGLLLIFCDNEPFTFEAKLLLKDYLRFDENENKGNKSANFIMKGNYNTTDKNEKIIKVFEKNNDVKKNKIGSFSNDIFCDSPRAFK